MARNTIRRIQIVLATGLFALSGIALGETAPAAAPDAAARRLLADRLLNDARAAARGPAPVALSARQAMLILQAAQSVEPESLDVLHALAEAAREARERTVLRAALRQIIRQDPGDLVAQVNLITVMAENAQAVDEQVAVYAATLKKESLDPQVRSEIALRYARLVMQSGDNEQARKLLDMAVQLNDVNAGAWEEIVRMQAAGPVRVSDRMGAIVNCLLANPYLPSVWMAGGRALAATNQHDFAAQFLGTAIDGAARLGGGGGELLLEWATELAIAGDPRAAQVLAQLAKLEDAPVTAMITSLAVSGPSLTAGAGADPIVARIRARVADSVKAAPDSKEVLADAAWIEVFYMPEPGPAASDYLDRFAKLAGENDDAVKVRRGWLLLRQGKLPEASALLTPLAAKDPFAQLGLVRIAAAQADAKTVAENLQDLYNAHPTGLLALHVASEARKQKVTLKDTPLGTSVRKAAAVLPASVFAAQAAPRDVMLMIPSLSKRRYIFGEPVVLSLKITNTTDGALSVGAMAAIKSSIGLAGQIREPAVQAMGLYTMENRPRMFRLAARGTYTETLRVDQDQVYEAMLATAWKPFSMSVTVVTDPQLTREGVVPGVGGQVVAAGEFSRDALQLSKMDEALKAADALPTLPPERQMITGLVLAQLLPELTDEKIGNAAGAAAARSTRNKIIDSLVKVIGNDSPVVKAWFIRMTPENVPEEIKNALAAAGESRDTAARLTSIFRAFMAAHPKDDAARAKLRTRFADIAEIEKDPLTKDFAATLAQIAAVPPVQTAPASQPGTSPGSAPASAPSSAPKSVPASAPAKASATTPAATPAN